VYKGNYNSFVESHIVRFNGVSEDNIILQKYTKDDFYQIHIQIILFYFNLNDDWSTNKKIYNEHYKNVFIYTIWFLC